MVRNEEEPNLLSSRSTKILSLTQDSWDTQLRLPRSSEAQVSQMSEFVTESEVIHHFHWVDVGPLYIRVSTKNNSGK